MYTVIKKHLYKYLILAYLMFSLFLIFGKNAIFIPQNNGTIKNIALNLYSVRMYDSW